MTRAVAPVVPLQDGDPSWANFDGTVRLRYNAMTSTLQLLVSVNNGDGTWSLSTFEMNGTLRDTRKINTQWPAYSTTGLPTPFLTTAEVDAQRVLDAQQRVAQRSSGAIQPPLDQAARKSDGYSPNP